MTETEVKPAGKIAAIGARNLRNSIHTIKTKYDTVKPYGAASAGIPVHPLRRHSYRRY